MFKLYNKQWKRVFQIKYINEYNQAVDEFGCIHDLRALRPLRVNERIKKHFEYY